MREWELHKNIWSKVPPRYVSGDKRKIVEISYGVIAEIRERDGVDETMRSLRIAAGATDLVVYTAKTNIVPFRSKKN